MIVSVSGSERKAAAVRRTAKGVTVRSRGIQNRAAASRLPPRPLFKIITLTYMKPQKNAYFQARWG